MSKKQQYNLKKAFENAIVLPTYYKNINPTRFVYNADMEEAGGLISFLEDVAPDAMIQSEDNIRNSDPEYGYKERYNTLDRRVSMVIDTEILRETLHKDNIEEDTKKNIKNIIEMVEKAPEQASAILHNLNRFSL